MVRLRAAAEAAAALPAPRRARRILHAATAVTLAALAGCSSAARGEPSNLGVRPGGTGVAVAPRAAVSPKPPGRLTSPAEMAVERACTVSKLACYLAARLDEMRYGSLLAALVVGGPVYRSVTAFLSDPVPGVSSPREVGRCDGVV